MGALAETQEFFHTVKFSEPMRNISTFDIIKEMGIGINLGNTFEACGNWISEWGDGTPASYETAWGSPVVTKSMIHGYAAEGFGVLRIPAAWSNLMSDDGNYTISKDYLARVRQVVDWALDEGLYVILNLHWDGGWLENLPDDFEECEKKFRSIWIQLCEEFKNYGDRLVFEGQNEELHWLKIWNHWKNIGNKAEAYRLCNYMNNVFVDIVRNSDGNNPLRHILIAGYNTDVLCTCDSMFKMPYDPAGRSAVSIHYYIPSVFAILEEDAEWGRAVESWGSDAEYAEMSRNLNLIKETFVDRGIPVIMGEYGCPVKNKDAESVNKFISSVCEMALERGGICPILWDTPQTHYDRENFRLRDIELHRSFQRLIEKYINPDEKINAVK